jgi:DNA-binding transcriptional ArsR family regulator/rhodanese-related sulfurtransferase
MGDADLKANLFEQFARVGKALGSGKRLELLDLIAQGQRTVESLARSTGLGMTTASAHLQGLKRAGLVNTRKDGTRVYYRLAGDDVAALYALVRDVAQAHISDTEHARAAYLGPETQAVTRNELLERMHRGGIVVLDVRPSNEYKAGHIPGAISIPLEELPDRLAELPGDLEIVAHCLAHDAVRLLNAQGHVAWRLDDGMLEWRLEALPVDTAA